MAGGFAGLYTFNAECCVFKNGQKSERWPLVRFGPEGIFFGTKLIRYHHIKQIRKYRDGQNWMFFESERINPLGKNNDGITYSCSPYSSAILRHNTEVVWEEAAYPLPPPIQVTSEESKTIIGVNTKLRRAKTTFITIFLTTAVIALAILI